MLNLKQLETFLWIARLGSFAAAADRLNSTQSAVSIRIQELEHALGVKLFDRSHRTVQLTPKGEDLAPRAEQLIEMAWDIQAVIGDPESISARIRIGVADLIALTWLGSLVSAVRDEYPGVKLEIDVGLAVELVASKKGAGFNINPSRSNAIRVRELVPRQRGFSLDGQPFNDYAIL